MKIRVGYELIYDFPKSTPVIMVLGTHFTRASDVIVPDYLTTSPSSFSKVLLTPFIGALTGRGTALFRRAVSSRDSPGNGYNDLV